MKRFLKVIDWTQQLQVRENVVGFEKAVGAVKVIKDQIQYRSQSLLNLARGYFINLTEENKKQEPCRQHSTMSLIKYQNQYPKIYIIPNEIKFYYKNDTQKSGNSPKRFPKIRE